MQSRSKGILSYDTLFAMLPVLLIIIYTMNVIGYIYANNSEIVSSQGQFDRLYAISDYLVKDLAAKKQLDDNNFNSVAYPNWIDPAAVSGVDIGKLEAKSGISNLYIGFDMPQDKECLYRLVVVGEQKEIRQLFICGDFK